MASVAKQYEDPSFGRANIGGVVTVVTKVANFALCCWSTGPTVVGMHFLSSGFSGADISVYPGTKRRYRLYTPRND